MYSFHFLGLQQTLLKKTVIKQPYEIVFFRWIVKFFKLFFLKILTFLQCDIVKYEENKWNSLQVSYVWGL